MIYCTACAVCGAAFTYKLRTLPRKFCGSDCRRENNRIKSLKWQKDNPQRRLENCRRWVKANPERVADINRRHVLANRDSRKQSEQAYRDKNRAACNARIRDWKKRNPDKVSDYAHRRRAPISDALPGQYREILYSSQGGLCFWTGDALGDDFHVDHIVPLSKGGSHSMDNLCLATSWANLKKNNKMPDEFWEYLWGDERFR